MKRLEWFSFCPADRLSDPGLQACSLAARGLWMACLCHMHRSEPYGHLTFNGGPMPVKLLARMVFVSETEAAELLNELRENGVFSETPGGVIYSRRMIRFSRQFRRRTHSGREARSHGR